MSKKFQIFESEELIKDHFRRVIKALPQDDTANWARELVQRIEDQELTSISLLADGKMSESLSDSERHSTAISTNDLYITISTFPCSVEEARRKYYQEGYLTYLDQMVSIARQENPNCHWLHFQFFWDGASFYIQFTLFPNKSVLKSTPVYHLPTDLLSDEEKMKVGLE